MEGYLKMTWWDDYEEDIKSFRNLIYNIWNTHTHPFNGSLSGFTRVSQYQKGKTNLDFTEARQ